MPDDQPSQPTPVKVQSPANYPEAIYDEATLGAPQDQEIYDEGTSGAPQDIYDDGQSADQMPQVRTLIPFRNFSLNIFSVSFCYI